MTLDHCSLNELKQKLVGPCPLMPTLLPLLAHWALPPTQPQHPTFPGHPTLRLHRSQVTFPGSCEDTHAEELTYRKKLLAEWTATGHLHPVSAPLQTLPTVDLPFALEAAAQAL